MVYHENKFPVGINQLSINVLTDNRFIRYLFSIDIDARWAKKIQIQFSNCF